MKAELVFFLMPTIIWPKNIQFQHESPRHTSKRGRTYSSTLKDAWRHGHSSWSSAAPSLTELKRHGYGPLICILKNLRWYHHERLRHARDTTKYTCWCSKWKNKALQRHASNRFTAPEKVLVPKQRRSLHDSFCKVMNVESNAKWWYMSHGTSTLLPYPVSFFIGPRPAKRSLEDHH